MASFLLDFKLTLSTVKQRLLVTWKETGNLIHNLSSKSIQERWEMKLYPLYVTFHMIILIKKTQFQQFMTDRSMGWNQIKISWFQMPSKIFFPLRREHQRKQIGWKRRNMERHLSTYKRSKKVFPMNTKWSKPYMKKTKSKLMLYLKKKWWNLRKGWRENGMKSITSIRE